MISGYIMQADCFEDKCVVYRNTAESACPWRKDESNFDGGGAFLLSCRPFGCVDAAMPTIYV